MDGLAVDDILAVNLNAELAQSLNALDLTVCKAGGIRQLVRAAVTATAQNAQVEPQILICHYCLLTSIDEF
jgi:hypothetical protein